MTRKHNISIIVSIHQPNVEILDVFDNLYVLSKGGVNVYSGPPQSLRQHMNDCHIDCNDNEIPVEKLLKVCANNYEHSSIINMRDETKINQQCQMEQVSHEMVINTNVKSHWTVKFSPISIWYLAQRMTLVYYHTLTLTLLFIIFMFATNGVIMLTYYNVTPTKYRDCQWDNSTQHCNDIMNNMTNPKNVQYEIKQIFGLSMTPYIFIGLWTLMVMEMHIKVFIWEYHNGLFLVLFHSL